jgi:hypothetical protein
MAADGSFAPRGALNRLTSLLSFLCPHFGQVGDRFGLIRFDKKLKITDIWDMHIRISA